MKPIFSTLCFLLISLSQLSAQFHLKVSLDEDGLYSVKLKSDVIVNPSSIVGSGQIVLTAPFGGFKIGEVNSVSGKWNHEVSTTNEFFGIPLGKDYFYINLIDGEGILNNGLSIEEEITLINFPSIGECTGAVQLITSTDKVVLYLDSLQALNPTAGYNYAGNLLSTFDILTGNVYDFSGVYDIGEAICNAENPGFSTSTENLKLKNSLKAWPNPFDQQTLIQFKNPSHKKHQLFIKDLSGKTVREISELTGNQALIERKALPTGLYFAYLQDINGNFAIMKIVVK